MVRADKAMDAADTGFRDVTVNGRSECMCPAVGSELKLQHLWHLVSTIYPIIYCKLGAIAHEVWPFFEHWEEMIAMNILAEVSHQVVS